MSCFESIENFNNCEVRPLLMMSWLLSSASDTSADDRVPLAWWCHPLQMCVLVKSCKGYYELTTDLRLKGGALFRPSWHAEGDDAVDA